MATWTEVCAPCEIEQQGVIRYRHFGWFDRWTVEALCVPVCVNPQTDPTRSENGRVFIEN